MLVSGLAMAAAAAQELYVSHQFHAEDDDSHGRAVQVFATGLAPRSPELKISIVRRCRVASPEMSSCTLCTPVRWTCPCAMKGAALSAFGKPELLEVVDMTDFVAVERSRLVEPRLRQLMMPVERAYLRAGSSIARHLKLD